jgi:hypothetical protein
MSSAGAVMATTGSRAAAKRTNGTELAMKKRSAATKRKNPSDADANPASPAARKAGKQSICNFIRCGVCVSLSAFSGSFGVIFNRQNAARIFTRI